MTMTVIAMKRIATIALLALVTTAAVGEQKQEEKPKPDKKPKNDWVQVEHKLDLDGRTLAYESTAGTVTLTGAEDKAEAKVFFVAYKLKTDQDVSRRPITFCFNGGPGSSSVWLHMGTFGPTRVVLDDEGQSLAPPFRLAPNKETILAATDLVFIDPVSTGFSRTEKGVKADKFHSVHGDVSSVGEFIRQFITQRGRWLSPKYIAGESYGATRASELASHLQSSHGMSLNGVILVSGALSFQALGFAPGNDLPYVLFLPSYAAVAHYHGQLPKRYQRKSLEDLIAEVRTFAEDEYAPALLRGRRISQDEKQEVASRFAAYTGLPKKLVLQSNLRVSSSRFRKHLLASEGQTIGRFDGRLAMADLDPLSGSPGTDPSFHAVLGPFSTTFKHYVREQLQFEENRKYEILAGLRWDFGKGGYLNVGPKLARAMQQNVGLRLFVANGYYDLATPFHSIDHVLETSILEPTAAERISVEYYEGGHMMYSREKSREKLQRDLLRFYREP